MDILRAFLTRQLWIFTKNTAARLIVNTRPRGCLKTNYPHTQHTVCSLFRLPFSPMPRITTTDTGFELQEGETLLEALERTGHDIDYQCRSGYCGSCRVKLRSGSVSYADMPMAFLLPDDILTCCCRVDTDITIDCRLRLAEPDLFDYEHDLFENAQTE